MKQLYEVKNFERLLGMSGFSNQLLKNHLALYEGYVKNANKLIELLGEFLNKNGIDSPQYAELKRRFGWELNGVKLHEYYFENLIAGGMELSKDSELRKRIAERFGSFQSWRADFEATAKMRGIGWAILYYDKEGGRLYNAWINEHDCGHISGLAPILVLDVFEHAYMLDYGLKRADYVSVFFENIDWQKAEERFLGE